MAEPTTYIVLHKWTRPLATHASSDSVSGAAAANEKLPAEAWIPVAEIDATRREDATKAYVEDATDLPEGDHEFKAVAKSSWGEESFPYTISTRRVVEAKKKEAVSANA